MEVSGPELARLRWQCRRGMLELDEILLAYVEQRYARAEPDEQAAFHRLLECQDPQLQRWLLLGEVPKDPALARLAARLRGHSLPNPPPRAGEGVEG